MTDAFENRVRAAAVAGWWTVLIAAGFVTLSWIIFLVVMSARPAWFLTMWGPDVDWAFVQRVWGCAIVFLKFVMWLPSAATSMRPDRSKRSSCVRWTHDWAVGGGRRAVSCLSSVVSRQGQRIRDRGRR
jgi:hypothetical protein